MKHRGISGLLVAAAAIGLLAGCHHGTVTIDDTDGVPLAQLDMKGAAPHGLTLAGPDNVQITTGDTLAITVDGDADQAAQLRFVLKGDSLGIGRRGEMAANTTPLTIHVTMPPASALTLAGSGKITAPALASNVAITVAGSGKVTTPAVAAKDLTATVAGSGSYSAAGHVDTLTLSIAGSGDAPMAGLTVGKAVVTVAGSGSGAFTSDGTVDGNIVGSGEVTVHGKAKCTVNAIGSGKLVCQP